MNTEYSPYGSGSSGDQAVIGGKQRGDWIDPGLSATLFAHWARDWLTTRVHLKPKTYAGDESALRVHILPRFGRTRLDRIDGLSIEEWMADLKTSALSASRMRQSHNVLSQVLKAAVPAGQPG